MDEGAILTDLTENEEEVQQQLEEEQKRIEKQQRKDLHEILHLPSGAGIRFFRRICAEGRMFRSSFTGNSKTFFLEGQRNLALKFFNEAAEADPLAAGRILSEDGSNG